jgi:hypothetical protein
MLFEGLSWVNPKSGSWVKINPPFPAAPGMSLTSTPHGLVAYGGEEEGGNFTKDIWVYSDHKWRPIATSLQARSYHASTWIPALNSLLIHGGYSSTPLSDFQLIDLDSGNVTQIQTDRRLSFSSHTVTCIHDSVVCLFGGVDDTKHLNTQLYEIDLSSGKVKVIESDNDLAARSSHQAYEFHGCLWITGGFFMGEFANTSSIFIFSRNIWLTIDFQEYLSNTWLAIPNKNSCELFNDSFNEARTIFFCHNRELFVDSNDARLIAFFSRLIDVNLRSDFVAKYEEVNITLLNEVEEQRKKLAITMNRKDPQTKANQITELISERDQIEQKLSGLELQRSKQMRRCVKSEVSTRSQLPKNWTHPAQLLPQLEQTRSEMKSELRTLSEQNEKTHSQLRSQLKLTPDLLTKLQPIIDDLERDWNKSRISEIDREIASVNNRLQQIKNQVRSLKDKEMSNEESILEAIQYIQSLHDRNYDTQLRLAELHQKFYIQERNYTIARYEELGSTVLERNAKDFEEFSRVSRVIEKVTEGMSRYVSKMPIWMSKLVLQLREIITLPDTVSPDDFKTKSASALHRIMQITELQNKNADLIRDKEALITLLPTMAYSWSAGSVDRPSNEKGKVSRQVRGCTNFSDRGFDLENSDWCEFYNQVITLVDEVDRSEQKQKHHKP